MDQITHIVETINAITFSTWTIYTLLLTGVIFTIWSGFGQYRALTHGVRVIRGKYDDKNDPGAINHFQALSAALSATVGLGNIAGVALAVALGGPGAIFWMWVIGILGMAIKMTEVTQSMLYRNTDDPENPHGGPMFVVSRGMARWGLGPIGSMIGAIFVVTLIISAITGGNMFQAWNVADITHTYFGLDQWIPGVILTILVGLVIIGGIKRIGQVAGRLVPFMCILYIVGALYVLAMNIETIPSMFVLIFKSAFSTADADGAFLGGTVGYAAMWGIKRALFSSESGQGSSPIAHSAAKTDEPVREGVVAGLEPFIDTIIVCTLTALVILSSGAYNRDPEATLSDEAHLAIVEATDADGQIIEGSWTLESDGLPSMTDDSRRIRRVAEGESGWRDGEIVFMIVSGEENTDTGRTLRRITGNVLQGENGVWDVDWGNLESNIRPVWRTAADGTPDRGVYGDYAGASLTAYAFDRVTPGMGKWLVTIAAWLFAISTMISWSYYGEQGVYFMFGRLRKETIGTIVLIYKLIYCALIMLTCVAAMPLIVNESGTKVPIIGTDAELDMWTTLGLGVMLVANIPIMLLFGSQAMKAYHDYFRRMDAGQDPPHAAPPISDVVSGEDVE